MPDDAPDRPGPDDERDDLQEMLRQFLSGNGDIDPAKLAGAAGLPADPAMLQQLMAQMQAALLKSGDGIDWSVSEQQARALAMRGAVPTTPGEHSAYEQALHVAALWLDEATDIAALTTEPQLLTRAGWAEATMPIWTQVAEPVATAIADALTATLREQTPDEYAGMLGDAGRLFRNVGGSLFAMQLGQVVGQLATEVVSGGDIGLPLLDGEQRQAVLVPQNVDAFGADLDVDLSEVRLYLAVRELAHARLFRHAKWLRLHLITQITEVARGTRIDAEAIQDAVAEVDPSNADDLKKLVESGALIPPKTDEQRAAMARLETMLALIEGWVDVVTAAATTRLPKATAIAEMVRRRRAAGGPAEHAFATLAGLELRPRRLREAAAMWQAVQDAVGGDERDALWAHPDIVPTDADIDDPAALVARLQAGDPAPDDVDRALEELLGDDSGDRPREA